MWSPQSNTFHFVALAAAILGLAACTRSSAPSSDKNAPFSSAALPGSAATLRPADPPTVRNERLQAATNTREILSALAKDCLPCAEENGCFDPKQSGGLCELATGNSKISGVSETSLCLDALRCIFTSKCANGGEESGCFCGRTDVVACMEGRTPPLGSCVAEFKKDFGDDSKTIYKEFINPAYGAGRANALIQCVIPLCPSCRIP
jgi:hypothetical protein